MGPPLSRNFHYGLQPRRHQTFRPQSDGKIVAAGATANSELFMSRYLGQ